MGERWSLHAANPPMPHTHRGQAATVPRPSRRDDRLSTKTEVCVLGSGSQGNALYIQHGQTRLLIDAGLTATQIKQRLHRLGVSLREITGILITHEHGDHIQGAKALSKDGGIPLWLNEGTRRTCRSFDSL